jgi:hypothetical protein
MVRARNNSGRRWRPWCLSVRRRESHALGPPRGVKVSLQHAGLYRRYFKCDLAHAAAQGRWSQPLRPSLWLENPEDAIERSAVASYSGPSDEQSSTVRAPIGEILRAFSSEAKSEAASHDYSHSAWHPPRCDRARKAPIHHPDPRRRGSPDSLCRSIRHANLRAGLWRQKSRIRREMRETSTARTKEP